MIFEVTQIHQFHQLSQELFPHSHPAHPPPQPGYDEAQPQEPQLYPCSQSHPEFHHKPPPQEPPFHQVQANPAEPPLPHQAAIISSNSLIHQFVLSTADVQLHQTHQLQTVTVTAQVTVFRVHPKLVNTPPPPPHHQFEFPPPPPHHTTRYSTFNAPVVVNIPEDRKVCTV